MKKMFPEFFKEIVKYRMKQTSKPLLGRWSLKHQCKSEDITVIHTTSDHCGDQLCGSPQQIKSQIDEAIKK